MPKAVNQYILMTVQLRFRIVICMIEWLNESIFYLFIFFMYLFIFFLNFTQTCFAHEMTTTKKRVKRNKAFYCFNTFETCLIPATCIFALSAK